jgi:cytochrome c oxidase subunit II
VVKDSHVDRVLNGKGGTAMPSFRDTLSDVELAAVITYERNSFGNTLGDMIQPAQIKALR